MVQAVVFLIILSLALSINSSFSEIHQKAGKEQGALNPPMLHAPCSLRDDINPSRPHEEKYQLKASAGNQCV
jgi:hypothetical protein